jgi:glycosyltransferase involved in cell wall biosynthesis
MEHYRVSDPVDHYLRKGWLRGNNPSADFSTNFYLDLYPEVREKGLNPLVHYEKWGRNENRLVAPADITDYSYYIVETSDFFDKEYYRRKYLLDSEGVDPVEHYLEEGFKLGYDPSERFSTDFYLSVYNDVYDNGVNPLLHYERHGKYEGRNIAPAGFGRGIPYPRCQKYPALLISHELSLTGAPMALMNMAKVLKKNDIEPLILTTRGGNLEDSLISCNIDYLVSPLFSFDLKRDKQNVADFLSHFKIILFNTIDSLAFAEGISGISQAYKVLWVHEGEAGFYANSFRKNFTKSFSFMDRIYSVGDYSKSFTDKYVDSQRSRILLYGLESVGASIPNEHLKMRFGIFGVICARKGTKCFVEAVQQLSPDVKDQCEFFIVGKSDSTEYANAVLALAEQEGITVTGELSHDESIAMMRTMDVVVCPSEDDPMPIVCTEAMQLGKGIIVSDQTGTASLVKEGLQASIYHLGQDRLVDLLEDAFTHRKELRTVASKNIEVYNRFFSMPIFEKNVLNIFENSI